MKNEKSDKLDPDVLYRQYQSKRLNFIDEKLMVESRATGLTIDNDSEPERLYQLYRGTRSADRDASIDAILHLISKETEAGRMEVQQQGVPVDQTKTDRRWYARLFSLPGDMLKKLRGPTGSAPPLFLFGIPALAACLVAVLVLPMLIGQPSRFELMPESLIRNASIIGDYVESSQVSSLGFSSGDEVEKQAFMHGVISTDIEVLESGRGDTASLEKLEFLKSQLASMGAVQSVDGKSAEEWFEVGVVVESISLAAQYAIDSEDSQPLAEALRNLKTAIPENNRLSSAKSLIELSESTVAESVDFPEVRMILDKVRSIKILMQ